MREFLNWLRWCWRMRMIVSWDTRLVWTRPLLPEEEEYARDLARRLNR